MNFSEQLQNMVYTTPVVNPQQKKEQSQESKPTREKSNKDMLNELGLAIKRR